MEDTKKLALITGANKGIGYEIARQLGAQGHTILLGPRDIQRGEEAVSRLSMEGINVHLLLLDVTDLNSIQKAYDYIETTFGKLDVLVNNAAIFVDKDAPSQLDRFLLDQTFQTNFFGVFSTIQILLPLIRKSKAGRIVNMSSKLGSLTHLSAPNWGGPVKSIPFAYNTSKTAVNALTIQFSHELKNTPIKINAADPGYTKTDMNDHQGYRTPQQGAKIAVQLATLTDNGPTGGFFSEAGEIPW